MRWLFRGFACACIAAAIAISSGLTPTSAIPVSTPKPGDNDVATPAPSSATLPYDSSLLFVLDDPISSTSSKATEIVRAHLKDPLMLNNKTIADAGTPVQIRIEGAQAAKAGDVYGYVDIYFEPLVLQDGKLLPLRAPTSHLTVNVSAGHESTVEVENNVEDVFIPYAALYQIFRKGRNFTLAPGSEIRARTAGVLSVDKNGILSLQTTLPVALPNATPVVSFQALPYATASSPNPGNRRSHPLVWTPSPEPSLPPLPTVAPDAMQPSTSPNPGLSPSPNPSPSPLLTPLPTQSPLH